MKNLSLKTMVIAAILSVALSANAQTTFSVRGGMNLSNVWGEAAEDVKMKIGYNIGAMLDYELVPNMGIQSGLLLTAKGTKGDDDDYKATMNMVYLQLPVHFLYKMDIDPQTKFVVNAGPYIAYGVGGKTSVEAEGVKVSVDTFGEDNMKRLDFGLGIGAGFEFGRIIATVGWDMGLINVADTEDTSLKTMNGFLSIGYIF